MTSEMIEYIVSNNIKYRNVTVNHQPQTMQSRGVFRHYKHVTPDTKTTINNQQITNIFISTPNSFIYTLCPLVLSIDNRFECSYFVNFVKFWDYKKEVCMKKNWKYKLSKSYFCIRKTCYWKNNYKIWFYKMKSIKIIQNFVQKQFKILYKNNSKFCIKTIQNSI